MKRILLLIFSLVFLAACQNATKQEKENPTENLLFETSFRDYKEIDILNNYEKVNDTSIYTEVTEDEYRLMELEENGSHLILFYKAVKGDSTGASDFLYRAIDTIQILNLRENERISLGYCQHEDYYEGELITVIGKTDSLPATNIIKAWRANPESEKIEELKSHEGIECLNEFLERENATIPIEEIS